jgi:hypothetical protein
LCHFPTANCGRGVKPFGYLLYWFVGQYRYSIFGQVSLAGCGKTFFSLFKSVNFGV